MNANTQLDDIHDRLVDFCKQNPTERLCDTFLRCLEDPLKPRDEHGHFRLNPILLLLLTMFVLGLSTFLFFSLIQS